MATFDANIEAIKTAQYGYQVRNAIAEALEQAKDGGSNYPNQLTYAEADDPTSSGSTAGKMITITLPNGKNVWVFTQTVIDSYTWITIAYNFRNRIVAKYRRFTDNISHTIVQNANDGSITINFSDASSPITRTTRMKIGLTGIETSVLLAATDESASGLGNVVEIEFVRIGYAGGYAASSTYYPGTLTNISYMPITMTDFGGPGECLQVYSGNIKTTFTGKALYRDLTQSGRVGCQFYTKFVYMQ